MSRKLLQPDRVRYLFAGAWNTTFGYGVGVGLYFLLSDVLHIALIGVITNILAISMSFITYKLFVFRARGNWLTEYLRSYLVYGATAIIGVIMLWLIVDKFGVEIWFAQAIVIFATVIISYVGHSRFTFRRK